MFLGTNLYGRLCGGGITSSGLQNAVINEAVNNISKQAQCFFFQYSQCISVFRAAELVAVGAAELPQVVVR